MGEPFELEDFLKWNPPQLSPIISDGLMYTGCKIIIYGKYKSLKSMLATRLCLSIANGKTWLGFNTVKSSIMYLQLEIPNPMLQERIKKMVPINTNNRAPFYIWTEPTIKIDTDDGFKRIEQEIIKYHPKVLVIDPIYKIVSGDLLSTSHIQKLTDWIDRLINDYQLSIVLVHHTRKGAYEEWGSDDMLGSVIFSAWADSIVKIERKQDKEVVVKFEVVRHAQVELPPRVFNVDLDTSDFTKSDRII